MKRMFKLFSLVALAMGLLLATPAWSQNRGGGQGSASKSQGASMAQRGGSQGQPAAPRAAGDRIHAPDVQLSSQQQAGFAKSSEFANKAMSQARGMAGSANQAGFGPEQARAQRDSLKGQIHGMLAEHDRLTQGFSQADRDRLGDRLRKLDSVRDRTMDHLATLDRACDGSGLDANRFARTSRELERDLKAWNKQYKKLGAQVDTGNG